MSPDDEKFRHECEVKAVAAMTSDEARKRYLIGVANSRGPAAAQRLREDVWQELKRLAAQ